MHGANALVVEDPERRRDPVRTSIRTRGFRVLFAK
jgi:hypothetical protein